MDEAAITLTRLTTSLALYCPPTVAEKKAAKAHPLSAQIITFTSAKERKEVFTLDYFKKKAGALPKDKDVIIAAQPATLAGLREGLIVYHFRKGKNEGFGELKKSRIFVERDYLREPTVKKAAEAGTYS